MVFNDRPLKRAKRVVAQDLRDFLTFPEDGDRDYSTGCFRSTVRSFVAKHAHRAFTPSIFPSTLSWQILFRAGGSPGGGDLGSDGSSPPVVALDVVEEDVARSRSVYCDQCRVVGWSSHPVCAKRYHFIIRAETPCAGYQKPCSMCGNPHHLLDSRCRVCCSETTTDDLDDWVYHQFEDTSHLLHGVIHSNGYGHLLRVNGREGGSKLLSGCDIMNFWDRLCRAIAVRKVSVMDVSKKYGLDYRLLHSVIKGHSWYGEWGYQFGSGSYALTQEAYLKAVHSLSSLPLSSFLFLHRRPSSQLHAVIAFYQSLSDSRLETVKDLFSFILRLIHETHLSSLPECRSKDPAASASNVLCVWTRDDVECVQRDLIKLLWVAARDSTWVTRRALKGALCKSASLELLDYCLKYLGGKVAGHGMVVQARCNPVSSAVEFRLEAHESPLNLNGVGPNHPSEAHVLCDLKYLYDSMINPQTMLSYRPEATRKAMADSAAKLLDCKQFMKDYDPAGMLVLNPFAMHLWCQMELADHSNDDVVPPPELILLPQSATVTDLKNEATRAFQEVYPIFKRFRAEELLDYGCVDDMMTVRVLVGSGGLVRVRGTSPGLQALSRFRMERGTESWTVSCVCGARDDDGERMLACDMCGVWQHTRCLNIDRLDAIPSNFVCVRCSNPKHRSGSSLGLASGHVSGRVADRFSSNCRNEAVATNGTGLGSGLSLGFGIR